MDFWCIFCPPMTSKWAMVSVQRNMIQSTCMHEYKRQLMYKFGNQKLKKYGAKMQHGSTVMQLQWPILVNINRKKISCTRFVFPRNQAVWRPGVLPGTFGNAGTVLPTLPTSTITDTRVHSVLMATIQVTPVSACCCLDFHSPFIPDLCQHSDRPKLLVSSTTSSDHVFREPPF